jgi:short-subunit dehydrogenase
VQVRGSVVIVTGAASGIGRATALALAAQGAQVVAIDRDGEALAEVGAQTAALVLEVDIRDPAHGERVVAETIAAHGRVDAIVANAGVGYVGSFAEMPVETISTLLDLNLRGPMLLIHAALPHMLANGTPAGLVLTTSIGGAVPVPREAAYGVSKTALESFADAVREELRGTNVSVSTVRPGVVKTAFHDKRNEPYDRLIPRPVPPEKIAAVILGLLETGRERQTVPGWLEVAPIARRRVPWLFRPLWRWFG